MPKNLYNVYILVSRDNRYYTGYTTDLRQRLKAHRMGKGAKFTRAFGVGKIVYQETFATKSAALKREAAIKRLPRHAKKKLIASPRRRYMTLPKSFFEADTLTLAQKLLGVCLVHHLNGKRMVGRIVETEAYLSDDPASHSFNGVSKRNAAMFGPPGNAYIYFTYGMHYCFNVVTGPKGKGEAVLIRALEPVEGMDWMSRRRAQKSSKKAFTDRELCNGPAKLVTAMGITPDQNNRSLLRGTLRLTQFDSLPTKAVVPSKRIGISNGKGKLYRFFLSGNPFVSCRPFSKT